MNILAQLRDKFRESLLALEIEPAETASLVQLVLPIQDTKFGDYQANCAMPLGKRLGKPPREVAQQLVARLQVADMCDPPEIAGPGFINLRLRSDWLIAQLAAASRRRVHQVFGEEIGSVVLGQAAALLTRRRQLPAGVDPAALLFHEDLGRGAALCRDLTVHREIHLEGCVENRRVAVGLHFGAREREARQLSARLCEAA